MKSIIPYTKTISFGSKIAEITSMSLEYELEKSQEEIHGNFIISGEYRSHEVSVNREPFLHKLPFSIEITDHIDLDSLNFEITDFSYDIVNDDSVEVDIEFAIEAEEIKEEPAVLENEEVSEENRTLNGEDPVADIMDLVDPKVEEVKTALEEELANEQKGEERKEAEEMNEELKERNENMKQSEETIIHNVNPMDDTFATYHIHIVKDGETIETICTMYHSNMNLLGEYNDLSNITSGDKVIIPKEDE